MCFGVDGLLYCLLEGVFAGIASAIQIILKFFLPRTGGDARIVFCGKTTCPVVISCSCSSEASIYRPVNGTLGLPTELVKHCIFLMPKTKDRHVIKWTLVGLYLL